MIVDRAYEGEETRQWGLDLGMSPVVPPKANRLLKWDYHRTIYKRRNEVEPSFRRSKGYSLKKHEKYSCKFGNLETQKCEFEQSPDRGSSCTGFIPTDQTASTI